MKKYAFLTTILLISSSFVMNAAAFTNGSFEGHASGCDAAPGGFVTLSAGSTCITDWAIGSNNVDYINGYWTAADGTHSVDLNGDGGAASISQTFDTNFSGNYLVSFAMAGNPDSGPAIKKLLVEVAGFSQEFTFDTTGTNKTNMGWITETFNFTATGTSSTLKFTSITDGCCFGPALDNVSVASAVPEPGSIVMVSMAAALLALGRRRLLRK